MKETASTRASRTLELAIQTRTWDQAAFDALFELYFPLIFHFCRKKLRHTQQAEDATSVTLEVALRNINTFRGSNLSQLKVWLLGIAYRRGIVDTVRGEARWTTLPLLDNDLNLSYHDNMEDYLEQNRQKAVIRRAIARLPDHLRPIVYLHQLEGLSHEEVAQVRGISIGTVKSRDYRARRFLRRYLERVGFTAA